MLSRLGYVLEIEQIGERLLISLVDTATGRAAASTKLDQIPPDREAAVAVVTQMTGNLVTQLQGPRSPEPMPQAPTVAPSSDDRAAREARERAEIAFREQAIGFGDELVVSVGPNSVHVGRNWTAHRGDLRVPLAGAAFYRAVGRNDLAGAYDTRRTIKYVGGVGSVVMLVASGLLFYKASDLDFECAVADECTNQDEIDRYYTGALVTAILSFVGGGVYAYYHWRPHPVSEGEAKQLAAEHNRTLRVQLGLPVATSRAKARIELGIAPYATADGGGIALGGRF